MVYAGPSVLLERGHMWNCSDVRYYALPPYNCNVHPGHPRHHPVEYPYTGRARMDSRITVSHPMIWRPEAA